MNTEIDDHGEEGSDEVLLKTDSHDRTRKYRTLDAPISDDKIDVGKGVTPADKRKTEKQFVFINLTWFLFKCIMYV